MRLPELAKFNARLHRSEQFITGKLLAGWSVGRFSGIQEPHLGQVKCQPLEDSLSLSLVDQF